MMRAVAGLAMVGLMAAMIAAPPAFARDKAAETPRALALTPIAVGDAGRTSSRLGDKLRLRVDTATMAPTSANIVTAHMHQRLAGQMIEYYPLEGKGFHLSAGTHLYSPRSPASEKTANALLYPAQPRSAGAMPQVGLRSTPAATMGYSGRIDAKTAIGIEMGAMKGRNYANEREVAGRGRDDTINPMINLTMGHKF